MESKRHAITAGNIKLYQRNDSPIWHCSAIVEGDRYRATTKQTKLHLAEAFAQDWYLDLTVKVRSGEIRLERTFAEAAKRFMVEYDVMIASDRNPIYVEGHKRRIHKHLIPFFGDKYMSQITAGLVQDYRMHRMENGYRGKPPARSTMHQEIVTLRQVLKTAIRAGWMQHLPDLSVPYRSSGKITRRAWFSREEYKKLYEATRRRAKNPKQERHRKACEELHDFVLFMANTGLRPDEAYRLQFRDVKVVRDEATDEVILETEVRGKRGVGYCKSTANAVRPFQRIVARNTPKANDMVFPMRQLTLLNNILEEEGLKFDREGQRRTAYSLRHTYICFRLMEGADIYQIAKNCRTSVEMIEKYYANHIKNSLDAAAINVRKGRKLAAQPQIAVNEHGEKFYVVEHS